METLIRIFKGENISLEQYIIESTEIEEEDWSAIELNNINNISNKAQIASEIALLEHTEQQDDGVVHLSGHGPNEYFSDYGYE